MHTVGKGMSADFAMPTFKKDGGAVACNVSMGQLFGARIVVRQLFLARSARIVLVSLTLPELPPNLSRLPNQCFVDRVLARRPNKES